MRTSKFVLLFQTAVTLVIAFTFLMSFIALDSLKTVTVSEDLNEQGVVVATHTTESFGNLKIRYIVATVVLLVVAVVEGFLIIRFTK